MIVYTDLEGRIKDVGSTSDSNLIEVETTDDTFNNWSEAKICCYKIVVDNNGNVIMLTPYVDSRLLDFIDRYGTETEKNKANIDYIAMMADIELMEG